jgi:hypothetical protein
MGGPISYTNLSRFMYVQAAGWAASMIFMPDMFTQIMGMPADAFKDKPMQLLKNIVAVCAVTMTALWAAVSQLDNASQRKCHQYAIVCYVIVLYGFFMAKDILDPTMWQVNIGQSVLNIVLPMLVLYVWNKPQTVVGPTDASKTRACRILYINFLLWGVLYLVAPEAVLTNFNCGAMLASPYCTLLCTVIGAVCITSGMLFAAAAQLGSDAQKKMLQYSMTNNVAWIVNMGAGGFGMFVMAGDQGVQKAQFVTVLHLGFIASAIHACYPSGLRMWILRSLYVLQAMTAIHFLTAPDYALASWGIDDKAVLGGAKWLGVQILTIALGLMAVTQCSDAVQKKYLQYTMYIPNAVVAYFAATGMDVGQALPTICLFTLLTTYDLYGDAIMAKLTSGKASMKTTAKAGGKSPRSRKRSATPMKR